MKNFLRFFGKLLSSPEIFLDLLGPYSRSEIAFLEEKKRRKKFLQQVTPLVRWLRDLRIILGFTKVSAYPQSQMHRKTICDLTREKFVWKRLNPSK